ncbi:MAG: hypothetical protein PPFGHCPK_00875 [Spiroplasma endosymbiont of Drosophila atripex]|nr:MAG: hypothetical protein PPFGHCPK_00875 [Spiroplasma endosymbiont of Drosophila atripex]
MSNNTWNQLWKNIVNNYKEILNINKNSEIINSDKDIKKIYIKKINKRFKQDKNSNKIIINLKDQIYLETSQWYLDETKKLETQIIKFNQNDINFKNASYQNSINEFCQKIFNKEKDYINIINNKCKFLKKTTFDFLIGLKKYFFLYQRIIKETYDAGYNLSKNPNQLKKLLNKIKTKIPTVFNEDIKLFMTLYSLLDKITWEYSISKINESENISILKKHPTMYLYFNNLLAIFGWTMYSSTSLIEQKMINLNIEL